MYDNDVVMLIIPGIIMWGLVLGGGFLLIRWFWRTLKGHPPLD